MTDAGNTAENNGATPPPPPPPEMNTNAPPEAVQSEFQPQNPPPPGPPPPPPGAATPVGGSNWYENVGIVILSLFCCWPLGLILVWINKSWTTKTKTIITAVMIGLTIVFAIIGAVSGGSSSTNASAPKQSTTIEAPSTTTTTITPEQMKAGILRAQEYACAEGEKDSTGTYKRTYQSTWGSVVTAVDFYAAIDACIQERRAATAQLKEAEYANAGGVDVDAMVKNPDAFKGQLFKFVVEITQYDAATGKCAFRGRWDNYQHQYNFEYAGDNAFFSSGNVITNCPVLDDVDAKDVIRVWARSTGAYSYSTQIGGSTTAPSFSVEKAEVIQKK